MKNWIRIGLFYFYTLLFSTAGFTKEAPLCLIAPKGTASEYEVSCERGESNTLIEKDSNTTLESENTFRLSFRTSLFNKPKVIHILDEDRQEVLRIQVLDDKGLKINSLVSDMTWLIEDLDTSSLEELTIEALGTLVIQNPLELGRKLRIETNSLYLLKPFSLKKGEFSLKYEDGFLAKVNFPFQSRIEGDFSIIESLSSVNHPSKRRISLNLLQKTEYPISSQEFSEAYQMTFHQSLSATHPAFETQTTEADRLKYIHQHVLSRMDDNKKKGALGEMLYQRLMLRLDPSFEYHDPKVGVNSFDSVHILRTEPHNPHSALSNLIISEVKYAAQGKPILGVIKLDGKEWRQLSLPYVHHTLDRMTRAGGHLTALADLIRVNQTHAKLRLAVYNPDAHQIMIYQIGTLSSSLLD